MKIAGTPTSATTGASPGKANAIPNKSPVTTSMIPSAISSTASIVTLDGRTGIERANSAYSTKHYGNGLRILWQTVNRDEEESPNFHPLIVTIATSPHTSLCNSSLKNEQREGTAVTFLCSLPSRHSDLLASIR